MDYSEGAGQVMSLNLCCLTEADLDTWQHGIISSLFSLPPCENHTRVFFDVKIMLDLREPENMLSTRLSSQSWENRNSCFFHEQPFPSDSEPTGTPCS